MKKLTPKQVAVVLFYACKRAEKHGDDVIVPPDGLYPEGWLALCELREQFGDGVFEKSDAWPIARDVSLDKLIEDGTIERTSGTLGAIGYRMPLRIRSGIEIATKSPLALRAPRPAPKPRRTRLVVHKSKRRRRSRAA